jgi:hypothetical protein
MELSVNFPVEFTIVSTLSSVWATCPSYAPMPVMLSVIVVLTVSVVFRSGELVVRLVSVLAPLIVWKALLANAVVLLSPNVKAFVTFWSVLVAVTVPNRFTFIDKVELLIKFSSGEVFALNQGWKNPAMTSKTPKMISAGTNIRVVVPVFFIQRLLSSIFSDYQSLGFSE